MRPQTGADLIRQQLQHAGLSQSAAARELGIEPRLMRRYCAGELPVPLVVTYALCWLEMRDKDSGYVMEQQERED